MQRRKVSREFQVEAVRLVRERGVSVAQAGRDLGVHETVLRKWVKEIGSDPEQAFPGHGKLKPEQLEIDRLRREVTKLKAECYILKRMARSVCKQFFRERCLIGLRQRIRPRGRPPAKMEIRAFRSS